MGAVSAGRVSGKVVLITGASDGIGKATAKLFAREGARVFATGRTQSKLDATVTEIVKAGGEAHGAIADLSSPESTEKAFQAMLDTYGRIDVLIHAAGVGYSWGEVSPGSMNDLATTPVDKWNEVIGINLNSVFHICRLAIPQMQKQKSGVIVTVASVFGMMGIKDGHTYSAAKGAIINLTRSLAVTYAKDGIRANCLCPGATDTGMIANIMPLFRDPSVATTLVPLGRAGTVDEMAYAALYLGCEESSYCTGSVMVVDGGWTAMS
jgi:NAD(P)-dependent dehydrogenase (short-subunit alcohol dehydrogenase family)